MSKDMFSTSTFRRFACLLLISFSLVITACGGEGEAPAALFFTSGGNFSTPENTTITGYIAAATDAEGDTVTYSLSGGEDQNLFNLNGSSGVLSFINAADFEAPADSDANNVYQIEISVTDGANTVALSVTVTVTDINDIPGQNPPVFTSGNQGSVIENSTATGYTTTATDPDGDTIIFSLSGGRDRDAFSIDSSSGVLSFNSAPDFETSTDFNGGNDYVVIIAASDQVHVVTQTVKISVTNMNDELPVFTSGASISMAENNLSTGYTATATDADGDMVTYSLSGGVDQNLFSLNSSSGVLSFINAPDFETPADNDANNAYQIEISATDGTHSLPQSVTVTVTDVTENPNQNPPVITSGNQSSVAENNLSTGYTATATDADGDVVTFSLTGGVDAAAFSLNADSGVLGFNTPADFEDPSDSDKNNSYVVEITASDGTHNAAISVTVFVLNSNDSLPVFTSASSISVAENNLSTGYTATATDADGDVVTFSLTGGVDVAAFSLNANSGVLSFNTAPDFELPTDTGGNNSYVVEITASDGTHNAAISVTVSVLNINEAPVFTSAPSITVAENNLSTGYTAMTTDADGDAITFSLTGGADLALLSISTNGVLSFVTAPDFELPTDNGADNDYEVQISATDGTNATVMNITVTVTDAFEVTVSTADIKTIQFDWVAFGGSTHYKLFVNPDGASGFSLLQVNITGTSTTIEIPVHMTDWVNASYIIEAHDASSKITESPAFTIVSEMIASIGYIKASNTGSGDFFSSAVSLSGDGDTLAVGAIYETSNTTGIDGDQNDNSASQAGAVYVFTRSAAGVWSQQAYIKASNTGLGDWFGFAVSLSGDGDTLAVGAYGEDSNATGIGGDQKNNSLSRSGAVFVFTRSATSGWSQQAYVKASNNTDHDEFFGYAVSLSGDGDTLAVSARDEDSNATGIDGNQNDNSKFNSGAVYVFTRSTTGVWSQQAYVKASNTDGGDAFGSAVSLSGDGDTLAVGAYFEASNATGIGGNQNDNSLSGSGAVYVFTRSTAGIWSQQAYVKASTTNNNDVFGSVVSLSGDGDTLVVSAPQEGSNATGIDGKQNDNSKPNSGAVYVFTRSAAGVWSQQAYVKASNTDTFDQFGFAISLSGDGDTLAVGAYLEASNATGIDGNQNDNSLLNAGAVYVFTRSAAGVWSQQAYVKASNTDSRDYFGFAVSLSGDGDTLAVGAEHEASNADGISGDQNDNSKSQSGAVYLY